MKIECQVGMNYKFEKLDVWKMSLDLSDLVYDIAAQLPDIERFNLQSQIIGHLLRSLLILQKGLHHRLMHNNLNLLDTLFGRL